MSTEIIFNRNTFFSIIRHQIQYSQFSIHSKPHALYSLRGASHLRHAKRASTVARSAVSIRRVRMKPHFKPHALYSLRPSGFGRHTLSVSGLNPIPTTSGLRSPQNTRRMGLNPVSSVVTRHLR